QPGQREGAAMSDDTPSPLNNVITINDERIKSHLDRVVRGTVEEALNALLDAEAERLCNAQRCERSVARRDTRAGHYERGLQTKAGEVGLRFRSCAGRRSRRRSSSAIGGARAPSKTRQAHDRCCQHRSPRRRGRAALAVLRGRALWRW